MPTYICARTIHSTLLPLILLYVTAACLLIQAIYWLTCLIGILRFKPNADQPPQPVSIIVCAHNELDNIKELIPQLLNQDHPDFEVIIVDDRSDDGTYDFMLAEKTEKLKFVNIDKVHDHINAKKYAITLGVRAAKNDILLFIDADCRPASDQWAKQMSQACGTSDNFVLGVSQYLPTKGLLNQIIRFETIWTAINYIGFALAGNPYMAVGRNLAYRQSYFLENKGFNKYQHIVGGDDDLLVNQLANKKNTQVVIGERTLTMSAPKTNWSEYTRQKVRHFSVSKYYLFKDKLLLGLQTLSHSIFWIAFISLATQTDQYVILGEIFLLRLILILNLVYFTSKKFGDRINLWLVPLMDIFYVIYITVFGLRGLFTRKVKWK